MAVIIKSDNEIALMREAGQIVGEILLTVKGSARAGMQTKELDTIAAREIGRHKVRSSFLNYGGGNGRKPFPAVICISVNDEIVHGIPGKRVLREGDMVKLDFGVIHRGWQGDSALSFVVGTATPEQERLMAATEQSLLAGIATLKAGTRMQELSAAIQAQAEAQGYSLVREYVGHGIGRSLHEEPQVPNFVGKGQPNPVLKRGMTLAIEPMVNAGTAETKVLADGWTVSTKDGRLSAHFEHTVAIFDDHAEVLTRVSSN